MMEEGVKNIMSTLGNVKHGGKRVDLGIDWANVIPPRDNLLDSGSPGELGQLPVTPVSTTKQQATSGQPPVASGPTAPTPKSEEPGQHPGASEPAPNTQPGQEPENITLEENEKRRGGRDREEEDDTHPDPNLPGQEEVQGEERSQNDQELEQEVEVTNVATVQLLEPGQHHDTQEATAPEVSGGQPEASVPDPSGETTTAGGTGNCHQQPSKRRRHLGPVPVQKTKSIKDTPIKATDKRKGRGKRSTKRKNVSTTDPAPQGHQPVTESAVGSTVVEGENEGSHSAPNSDPPEAVEQEQEIPIDISDLLGSTILSFQPLNPGNSTERRPDQYIPIYTSTPARRQNFVSGRDVLWISGLRPEFPMINNSMEETGQRNSVFNIHLELGPFGYELTRETS